MVFKRVKKLATKTAKKTMAKTKAKAKATKTRKGAIDETMLNSMIQERAYFMWEEMGKPQSSEVNIWLEAEKEIKSKLNK